MSCNIIFKMGDKEISIESESPLYPTNDEILEALKNNEEKRRELFLYIDENYNINDSQPIRIESEEDFLKLQGITGNTNILKLIQLKPGIFQDGVFADVLLVNNLKYGNRRISGRVINSNGKEIFVVKNQDKDLYRLANFLKVRKILLDNPLYIDENSEYYQDLLIIKNLMNYSDISTMLIDFLERDSEFRGLYYLDSNGTIQSVFVLLDKIGRDINNRELRIQYSDPFTNTIHQLLRSREKDKDKLNKIALTYSELYYAINAYYPELLKSLEITSENTFKSKVKSSEFDKTLFNNVIEDKPLIYTLLDTLLSKDYNYKVVQASNKEVVLKLNFNTLKSRYGFTYDTVKTFDIVDPDFKGYKIFSFDDNGKKVFIYSKTYLTENTNIYNTFNSIEDIKEYISRKILDLKLRSNSYTLFKFRNRSSDGIWDSSKYLYKLENSWEVLTIGSVVEVLEIPIDPHTVMLKKEKDLITSKESTLKDFYNLVNTWNISDDVKAYIISNLDNAEKAVTFLYKINELLKDSRENGDQLVKIVNDIISASKIAYYINSNSGTNYTLIPTKPNEIDLYRDDKQFPVILTLQAVQQSLLNRFNVNINLLTSSQIATLFPKIDSNTSKAFILNGEIYINTTIASGEDLLHEYSHIILGVLKSNPESRKYYELLINHIWSISSKEDKDNILKTYSDLSSTMDIREELFVKKFAEYLLGQRKSELDEIFKLLEVYIKEGVKTIFDLIGDEPLARTYSRSIDTVFRRFSSDVATLLERGNGLDFEKISDSRRLSTFINNQIKDNKIIEQC